VAITGILRRRDLPFLSNKSAMTSSTGRSGCTSPRDFGAFFDYGSVYIQQPKLDRISSNQSKKFMFAVAVQAKAVYGHSTS